MTIADAMILTTIVGAINIISAALLIYAALMVRKAARMNIETSRRLQQMTASHVEGAAGE
jgi:uncharacterized protein YggT (Ycf19 family)